MKMSLTVNSQINETHLHILMQTFPALRSCHLGKEPLVDAQGPGGGREPWLVCTNLPDSPGFQVLLQLRLPHPPQEEEEVLQGF